MQKEKLNIMGRPKSKDPKTKNIAVWVTEKEYQGIKNKAHYSALSTSSYLRTLGMNYRLKSKIDAIAVEELVKAKADLGRIGGLFKLWLVHHDNGKTNLGSKSYNEVEAIIGELEKKQIKLLSSASHLMNECK